MTKSAPNPFDLDALRTPPDYRKSGATKTVNLKIRSSPKAPREKFIRVHPFDVEAGDWNFDCLMYEYNEDGTIDKELFIVPAGTEAFNLIGDRANRYVVVAAVTKKGDLFLWELRVPDPDGDKRSFAWHATKLECAKAAVDQWVAVEADTATGAYKYSSPLGELGEPSWPETLSFPKMLELAYTDRIIKDADHPVVKEILGLA